MVQKHIVISMIAPVAVLGILTLSVLAAISSTNQAFAQNISPILYLEAACELKGEGNAARHVIHLAGSLTFEGRGVKGVDIKLTGTLEEEKGITIGFSFVKTNENGGFHATTYVGPGVHIIFANAHFVDEKHHEQFVSARARTPC
jgi:hypothetical protein